jgi:hypothetical protein
MLFILLPQFDIVALKRQFDEPVDRLTGAARERVRQISGFAAADGKLWFGHDVPRRMVA